MFAGHLAVALGTRKAEPELPLWTLVAAVFWLDLVWPVFLILGIETVRVNPGDTAFTSLAFDSYPWSHSLLMALVWSAGAVAAARLFHRSWRASALLGALVLSHWILDFVTHRPDLPLWPGGPLVGLGLWNSVPGTLLVEGGLYAAGIWLYARSRPARDGIGRWAFVALTGLVGLIWATQPWSPPPPSAMAIGWVGLASWLFLPWAAWIDRHRGVEPRGVRA